MYGRNKVPNNRFRAVTLIVVVAMLMALSIMAITFSRMSIIERAGSQNLTLMLQARFNALAGLEAAITNLREEVKPFSDITTDAWVFKDFDILNSVDHVGAGVDITNATTKTAQAQRCIPSYPAKQGANLLNINSYYFSGSLDSIASNAPLKHAYTLKILDTSSQIDLNHPDTDALKGMLAVLFSQVFDTTAPAQGGTWQTVANNISAYRETLPDSMFRDKRQIIGGNRINAAEFMRIRDFVTIHGWRNPHTWIVNGTSIPYKMNCVDTAQLNVCDFTPNPRAPVNINTASKPVLVAVLANLKGYPRVYDPSPATDKLGYPIAIVRKGESPFSAGSYTSMTTGLAEAVAAKIIDRRYNVGNFQDWSSFNQFIDGLSISLPATLTDNQKALIKANANPNAMIHRWIANKERYQAADKSDLLHPTAEFCFGPSGYFEISSVGRVWGTADQRLLAEARAEAVVQLDELVQHTSQRDFYQSSAPSSVTLFPETTYHCQPNNSKLTDAAAYVTNGSPFEGYVQLELADDIPALPNRISRLFFNVDASDFNSLWSAKDNAGEMVAPLHIGKGWSTTAVKWPVNANGARSAFKGESRAPDGCVCTNYGSLSTEDATSGGQVIMFNPVTLGIGYKAGTISLWIKFEDIGKGSEESILYLNQKIGQYTVTYKDAGGNDISSTVDVGCTMKVIRYGDTSDEIHVVRFLWEDPIPAKIEQALTIPNTSDVPVNLWTRVKIPLTSNRNSRQWYRLVVGWEDYTNVYGAFTNNTAETIDYYGNSRETLANKEPPTVNPGLTKITRLEWRSGSPTTAGGDNQGYNYLAIGGDTFTAQKTGGIHGYAAGMSYNKDDQVYRFANAVISHVEIGSDCQIAASANSMCRAPYTKTAIQFSHNIKASCGCGKSPGCGKIVSITCANYTIWNPGNPERCAVALDGNGIDNAAGTVPLVTTQCGNNLPYEVTLQSPDDGLTTPIFDDLTIYCRLSYPRFLNFQWNTGTQ